MTSTSSALGPESREAWSTSTMVALIVTLLAGMRVDVIYGLTIGGLAAIALVPVWGRLLLQLRWSRVMTITIVAAIFSGAVLTMWASADHGLSQSDLLTRSLQLIQLVAILGAMLWSHVVAGVAQTCIAFAVGGFIGIPLNISSDPNFWRFTLSIPLGILILTLASNSRQWIQLAAAGGLALVGLLNDSRSNSAFLLLAILALVWQRLRGVQSRRARGFGGVMTLIAGGIVVFYLLQSAILEGYFGEATQQRTSNQIDRSGSLLLGGRPEIAASFALIVRYPFGFGSGTNANYSDITAAKSGMLGIGYDPNNGYVERFMFGGGAELHSVTGDLWLWFGLAGLALAILMLALLFTSIARALATGTLTVLFAYLCVRFLWDLAFSPVTSTLRLWPLIASLAIAYASYAAVRGLPRLAALYVPKDTMK